ncbi:DNA-directed DNA polymerase epsilon, subunit B [Malassezia pachydermatis]
MTTPAHVPPDVRRTILRAFTKKRHLQLQSDAVQFIFSTLEEHDLLRDPDATQEAIEALAGALVDQHVAGAQIAGFDGHVVTGAALQKVYDQLLVEAADDGQPSTQALTQGDTPEVQRFFAVCDAFSQPWIRFHGGRKVFENVDRSRTLLPTPEASSAHMIERYELLKSVVLRNEHFLPALTGQASQRNSFMHLTTTKNLLGRQGEHCLLFGRLSTSADGTYVLEDTEGTVRLDLSRAMAGEGIFTEGAFVLVEGEYTKDECLQVVALGHPPSESREQARMYTGHLDWHGSGAVPTKHVAALQAQEAQHLDVCMAVFSDVYLNEASTLRHLRAILQGYQDADFLPLAIVLCGPFSSVPVEAAGAMEAYMQGFAHLADVLLAFPRVLQSCHLVLVPGARDPAATPVLPRPRIPAPLVERMERKLPRSFVEERLHWMSNPCRLVYFSQEIVVFRDDIMSKMLRSAILLKDQVAPGDLQKYLVSTLLDQAYLCPLPAQVRPVLWEYANALCLYPMPSAVRLRR